jgi:hydroxymethylbilane synthase
MTRVRLGTRASPLALVQARTVAAMLERTHAGVAVEIVEIATKGDVDRLTPLAQGTGWFTTAIQEALLRGEADFAVHSYKDLPTKRIEGLVIACIPLREDPRDAFVSASGRRLHDLPAGATVGTGSPRREAQLRGLRPDLDIRPIRGNVDTRLAKVAAGEYDGVVLALAGIRRLGQEARVTQVFGFEEMLPAPAQGALALECRSADATTRALLAAIDDPSLRSLVTAERAFLATLEAGCSFPAAAYAEHFGTTLKLHGLVAPDGPIVRSKMAGAPETAAGLGRSLATELMALAGMRK